MISKDFPITREWLEIESQKERNSEVTRLVYESFNRPDVVMYLFEAERPYKQLNAPIFEGHCFCPEDHSLRGTYKVDIVINLLFSLHKKGYRFKDKAIRDEMRAQRRMLNLQKPRVERTDQDYLFHKYIGVLECHYSDLFMSSTNSWSELTAQNASGKTGLIGNGKNPYRAYKDAYWRLVNYQREKEGEPPRSERRRAK